MADRHMQEAWADEHEHEEEEEEGLDDVLMPPEEEAQEMALRMAEAARARGLPPGAAGSAMQARECASAESLCSSRAHANSHCLLTAGAPAQARRRRPRGHHARRGWHGGPPEELPVRFACRG